MKKYLCLLLALAIPMCFASCGDDDEPEVKEEEKEYEVVIHNSIDKSQISSAKSDGNLYDIYIVSADGTIYPFGSVLNKESRAQKLKGYNIDAPFFLILKWGKNEAAAKADYFSTPEQSSGKIRRYQCHEDEATHIYITENTTYGQFGISDIGEFQNMMESILLSL